MSNPPTNNAAAPEKIRLFLAIFPLASVVARLEQAQTEFQKNFSIREIRWTKPEQIHLTLHFFGHVHVEKISGIESTIHSAVRGISPFEIRAEQLGCFPSMKHPRILWAGLSDADHALEELKARLDDALGKIGCEIEARKFHPHLTLARIGEMKSRDTRQFCKAMATFGAENFGAWTVKKIQLTQSALSREGATYSMFKKFPFQTA